jgi:AcrR family transcriptional regulator
MRAVKSDETRTRILTAALELFRERGFAETTMREIAARAGVATGAAYYYFVSKDAIVMAFYQRAMDEMQEEVETAIGAGKDLRRRLTGLIEAKLKYFEPSRRLLAALAAHVDPANPLSPFSEATREIRDKDIETFARAIDGGNVHVPDDLKMALPRILWLYQMGVILYWIHDGSPKQRRTMALVEKSVGLVVRLLRVSSLPLMRPLRKQVLELYGVAAGE